MRAIPKHREHMYRGCAIRPCTKKGSLKWYIVSALAYWWPYVDEDQCIQTMTIKRAKWYIDTMPTLRYTQDDLPF